MIRWVLGLATISTLAACGGGSTEQAKEAVTKLLSFRIDVGFRNIASYPGDVVCGEFEEQNTMGGSYGFKPFIVRAGVADNQPPPEDIAIYCSADPAASLQAEQGIGPLLPEQLQVQTDLETMAAAVAAYLADNHMMPTNRQGLDALVTLTSSPPLPLSFRQGGYLKYVPNDPWDRPYHYDNSAFGGSVGSYSLYTLGADNSPGGTGENADIDVKQLPYIQHIIRLQPN